MLVYYVHVMDSNRQPVAPGERDARVVGYSHGTALKTGLQLPSASSAPYVANQFGRNYFLTLPRRVTAGACAWSAPVEFLVDSADFCEVAVTTDTCSEGSALDARMYAPSADWGVATGPVVLHRQASSRTAKTDVYFLCVRDSTSSSGRPIPKDTEICFSANRTCGVDGPCGFEALTSAYVCPRLVINENRYSPYIVTVA